MPDYSACYGTNCAIRNGCARFRMVPGTRQSITQPENKETVTHRDHCEIFWDIRKDVPFVCGPTDSNLQRHELIRLIKVRWCNHHAEFSDWLLERFTDEQIGKLLEELRDDERCDEQGTTSCSGPPPSVWAGVFKEGEEHG